MATLPGRLEYQKDCQEADDAFVSFRPSLLSRRRRASGRRPSTIY